MLGPRPTSLGEELEGTEDRYELPTAAKAPVGPCRPCRGPTRGPPFTRRRRSATPLCCGPPCWRPGGRWGLRGRNGAHPAAVSGWGKGCSLFVCVLVCVLACVLVCVLFWGKCDLYTLPCSFIGVRVYVCACVGGGGASFGTLGGRVIFVM